VPQANKITPFEPTPIVDSGGTSPLSIWTTRVKIHDRSWLFERAILVRKTMRENLYIVIADGISAGLFSKMKKCDGCKRVFVARDPRRSFCKDQCRIDFNNRRRLEGGYFISLRHQKRKTSLARARGLLKQGIEPEVVARRIEGLTVRILEREDLVPRGERK